MRDVKQENLGWRDESISRRHRLYGYNLPCVDIDFMVIEYLRNMPVAIIDYKHERAIIDANNLSSGVQAQVNLANMAKLPAFVVQYEENFKWFWIIPLNSFAKDIVHKVTTYDDLEVNEERYIKFLHYLRGVKMTDQEWSEIKAKLN